MIIEEMKWKFILFHLGGDYRSKSPRKSSTAHADDDEEQLIDDENEDELNREGEEKLTVNIEEADLLRGTLSDLLRNLLCDRVFADTLPEMIAEPIPYFTQLQYSSLSKGQDSHQDSRLSKEHVLQTHYDDGNIAEQDQSLTWSIGEQEKSYRDHPEYAQKKNPKQISSTPVSLSDFELKPNLEEKERLKTNPNVTSLIEDIVENTLWNILQEAYHNEFSLTARPRLIALPPKRQSALLTRANLQKTDSNPNTSSTPPLIMTESFD